VSDLEAQVRADLDELAQQIEEGEIDPETGARLRSTYLAELESARTAPEPPGPVRSRPRMVVGALILVAGFAVTVAVLGSTAEPGVDGALQGVAAAGSFDPSEYSDETLEAVIAASADDPAVADQIPFMRFALAERYFDRNDFQRAFRHYEAILSGEPTVDLFAAIMTRVAWITFVGNGEVELSLDVIDRAIEAMPGSTEALYVKGQILWCGSGDAEGAASLFERILQSNTLTTEIREQVGADLAAATAGEPCR
jgi:tetratricopeptide (TPR) repeat protein